MFEYKDKIVIIKGFYKGLGGEVIAEELIGDYTKYTVRLTDGNKAVVSENDIKIREGKEIIDDVVDLREQI